MENKEEQIKRDLKITFKVTEEERDIIKSNAYAAQMSMSKFIRELAIEGDLIKIKVHSRIGNSGELKNEK